MDSRFMRSSTLGWAFFAAMFCAGGVGTSFAIGDRVAPLVWGAGALVSGWLARRWSRIYPSGPAPRLTRAARH